RGRRVLVRRAREGERLLTLDGVERTLSSDDLVIADGEGPVALAGVMGGGTSEIAASTSRVLLECAYFDPRSVRRAARRHALHTESSHRFERGVDWGDTAAALARAAELVARSAGGALVSGPRVVEARPLPRRTVSLRHERLRALLGADVHHGDASVILDRLGFVCRASQPGSDAREVPSHRSDVSREVDLIEEVARVRGYDAIPRTLPAILPSRDHAPRQRLARRAREAATAVGLSEAITYAFVSRRDLEAVGAPAPAVVLRNPLRDEQSVMRTSLLPGLFRVAAHGGRRGVRDMQLFSVGALFAGASPETASHTAGAGQGPGGAPQDLERLGFAALLAGDRSTWLGKPQPVDVWDAKGLAEGVVRRLLRRGTSVLPTSAADTPRHLHPRGAAWIEVDGKRVGSLGPLHPDVADAFELGESVVVVELELDVLDRIGSRAPAFVELPRYPASERDIAVVVRDDVAAGDVVRAVRDAAGDLAEEVSVFDRFAGGNVPSGHASLGLHVVYRARDRTLTDAEVDARHAQVVAQIGKQFGGHLRA
ncbi:MAG TPA: phenylalanine--tRNA ligase subunit beta, partial [Polyangiaceae bacterium]|nr:phenylalanine--tRNA ligase subunit beta [Polyangiaceae bacterium]